MTKGKKNSGQTILPGSPFPLGAAWDGNGVNFALFSRHASRVELCLFDSPLAAVESSAHVLRERTGDIWHGYIPGAGPGLLYGFRVSGPFDPGRGHWFNPHKLLSDPYARAFGRPFLWNEAALAWRRAPAQVQSRFAPCPLDSAFCAPLSRVVDPHFNWEGDAAPAVPAERMLIYEAHVKGLTMLHPSVPSALRGTFAGLASEPIIEHLLKLGVTAVELLPVHQTIEEEHLQRRGLINYWGYNTLSYFAPDLRFCTAGEPPDVQFKAMVKRLHQAGIEVILDVVYNHTCEGNSFGPSLCYRGIDNASYYRLDPADPLRYIDYTGCGNTLNTDKAIVLRLIADSLRYWVQEMHVDGFRFDLATALCREKHKFDEGAGFLDIIAQDPVLSRVKLIAEPWDIGDGGYQLGGFPTVWSEWNDRFRITMRSFWRGDDGMVGKFASAFAGSSDIFAASRRPPASSINYVTAHDGFTLKDLVSFSEKHNQANGEENRDGESHNLSWNCGVEGPTKNRRVQELRERQRRNFAACLLLAAGTPMLLGGDELGRTQRGNNNAYCQDNELSWLNWELPEEDRRFLEFVQSVSALRRDNAVFRATTYFTGIPSSVTDCKDIAWYSPLGAELSDDEWRDSSLHSLGILYGPADGELHGERFFMICHASASELAFFFPKDVTGTWQRVFDTGLKEPFAAGKRSAATHRAAAYSVALYVAAHK